MTNKKTLQKMEYGRRMSVRKAKRINQISTDNIKGVIFHIIHGSFVDGYGVRTTVFLKGCPLRCAWCCNPEGQEEYLEIKLTPSKCSECGSCLKICPTEAITLDRKRGNDRVRIDRKLCTNCGKCIEVCFTGTLEYFGKYMTVAEVFNIVKKDEPFYNRSGGGVTIGGGEPTFQHAFTYALMKKCQENRIHVALDTCGYTLDSEGLKCLEEANLVLFDMKGMDPKEHLRNTGVSNKLSLRNLRRLADRGTPIIIRMPIVPGYNDSIQNIKDTAEFLSELNSVERVDLLPYHKYGTVKYGQLGKIYRLNVETPSQEYINSLKSTFERYGLKTQIGG